MAEFEIFVDDNYHYMDEESRYRLGSFASYSDALAKAKAIIDDFLAESHCPGMTSKELFEAYTGFGEDPFIVPAGEPTSVPGITHESAARKSAGMRTQPPRSCVIRSGRRS